MKITNVESKDGFCSYLFTPTLSSSFSLYSLFMSIISTSTKLLWGLPLLLPWSRLSRCPNHLHLSTLICSLLILSTLVTPSEHLSLLAVSFLYDLVSQWWWQVTCVLYVHTHKPKHSRAAEQPTWGYDIIRFYSISLLGCTSLIHMITSQEKITEELEPSITRHFHHYQHVANTNGYKYQKIFLCPYSFSLEILKVIKRNVNISNLVIMFYWSHKTNSTHQVRTISFLLRTISWVNDDTWRVLVFLGLAEPDCRKLGPPEGRDRGRRGEEWK